MLTLRVADVEAPANAKPGAEGEEEDDYDEDEDDYTEDEDEDDYTEDEEAMAVALKAAKATKKVNRRSQSLTTLW